jgi:HSP20 family protein
MDQYLVGNPWPNGIRAATKGTYTPIKVGITLEQVDAYLFVPGVDPKTLEITIHQNLLPLKGERRLMRKEGGEYYRKERFSGGFHRPVNLPEDAGSDRVDAGYKEGVLHLTIGHLESAKPRQIEVN